MSQSTFIKIVGVGIVEGGWKLLCIMRSRRGGEDSNEQEGKLNERISLSLVSIRLCITTFFMCLKQLEAKEKLMGNHLSFSSCVTGPITQRDEISISYGH
jgi:hypothetical protein